MIKRIKNISGVGQFYDSQSSDIDFGQLTYIYGLNTWGKSTLCDILKSMPDASADIIKERKSIPYQSKPQNIKISLQGDGKELTAEYNEAWRFEDGAKELADNIFVFDSKFVEDSIYTADNFTQRNRENMTDFLIGEKAVTYEREKEKLKNENKNLTNERNRIVELIKVPKGIDLDVFIKLKVTKDLDLLSEEQAQILEQGIKIKETIDKCSEIKNEKFIVFNKQNYNYRKLYDALNQALQANYNINLEDIFSHINKYFDDFNKGYSWIEKGVINSKNKLEECPFCGQKIGYENIVNDFKQNFADKYSTYKRQIEQSLAEAKQFNYTYFDQFLTYCLEQINKIEKFKKYIDDRDFLSIIDKTRANIENYSDKINAIKPFIKLNEEAVLNLISKKSEAIYKPINKYNFEPFINRVDDLEKNTNTIFENIDCLIRIIEDFRKDIDLTKLSEKRMKLQTEYIEVNNKIERVSQDKQCQEVIKLDEMIRKNKDKIKTYNDLIKEETNSFLNSQFESINKIYQELGSRKFELSVNMNAQGNRTVAKVNVKFNGVPVKCNDLRNCFSESDKRALALAIFWSKILNLSEPNKAVIVLDDPVTSFDDNRISAFNRFIKNKFPEVNQIILTSHYIFARDKFMQEISEAVSLEIAQKDLNNNYLTSTIVKSSKLVTKSKFEICFNELYEFANNKKPLKNDEIKSKVRIFLDHALKYRFIMALADYSQALWKTCDVLKYLYDQGSLERNKYNDLDSIYKSYCEEHHDLISTKNQEELRNDILVLLNSIYN